MYTFFVDIFLLFFFHPFYSRCVSTVELSCCDSINYTYIFSIPKSQKKEPEKNLKNTSSTYFSDFVIVHQYNTHSLSFSHAHSQLKHKRWIFIWLNEMKKNRFHSRQV